MFWGFRWFGLVSFFFKFGPKVVLSLIGILSLHLLVKMCEQIMVQAKPAGHNPQENQIGH